MAFIKRTEQIKNSLKPETEIDSLVKLEHEAFIAEYNEFLTKSDIEQMTKNSSRPRKWDFSKIKKLTFSDDKDKWTKISEPMFNTQRNKAIYIVATNGFKGIRVFQKKQGQWTHKYTVDIVIND